MDFPAGPATPTEQLEAVKAYAQEHYAKGGWDIIVECRSDEEILAEIKGTTSRWGAVERINKNLKPLAAYRQEVESTAF